MTGYFGETTNAVMTDVQCKRAFADANDANNVAVAAYNEFVETWRGEQQKIIDAQKKAAGGKKVEVDRSMLNIMLEKPGRKKVQPGEPFLTRKEAETEKAAREARDTATLTEKPEGENQPAAKAPNAAGGSDGSVVRSQQLALFLSIAEKHRKTLHDPNGSTQGAGHTTRMGANNKKLLTGKPPPLDHPSE